MCMLDWRNSKGMAPFLWHVQTVFGDETAYMLIHKNLGPGLILMILICNLSNLHCPCQNHCSAESLSLSQYHPLLPRTVKDLDKDLLEIQEGWCNLSMSLYQDLLSLSWGPIAAWMLIRFWGPPALSLLSTLYCQKVIQLRLKQGYTLLSWVHNNQWEGLEGYCDLSVSFLDLLSLIP